MLSYFGGYNVVDEEEDELPQIKEIKGLYQLLQMPEISMLSNFGKAVNKKFKVFKNPSSVNAITKHDAVMSKALARNAKIEENIKQKGITRRLLQDYSLSQN